MIWFFMRITLHNLHILWNSITTASCIWYSPASIPKEPCSIFVTSTGILQRIGHLTIVSMMFQNSSKIPLVKQRNPIPGTILNNLHIIRSRSWISTSREYWIMIACKSIFIHISSYIALNKSNLALIRGHISRI